MTMQEHNQDIDRLVAMDRLIYQTDTCRIFHFATSGQDQSIRNIMTNSYNRRMWRLEYEAMNEDNFTTGYLIYHLRSNG